MLVGEQPGDQEDLAGKAFVGPAGQLLDRALAAAGIERSTVYVTNAVKHFRFEPRGKRRIHKKPDQSHIEACRWWLDWELAVVRPALVVALGATAAEALLGRSVRILTERGAVEERPDGLRVLVTVHPSFLLRLPEAKAREREFAAFVLDLQGARLQENLPRPGGGANPSAGYGLIELSLPR
jgi:DNA polymerase